MKAKILKPRLKASPVKAGLPILIDDLDENTIASELQASLGLFVRWLRQPVPGELTLPEMSALSRLERAGPATMSDLARAEQITPQAMSATLAGLGKRGLVERRPDPADGRRAVVSATGAGQLALRCGRSARAEQLAKALVAGGFTRAELDTLAAAGPLIKRLSESL
ncbi:MarR family transcriptional regulator [Streptomyces sp. DSM 41524]|uniref:MarR family transcriptional regulator n=1 Tax=Streptomyces asiaticus subsp. ignotus TaxID=3098222 RepID=A0ABU7Q3V3_9ACTN|nr:MarR family transcriptional regulator [Streptomyces sp. DSM 41524]